MTVPPPPRAAQPLLALAAHGLAGSMFDMPAGPFAPDEWFHLVRSAQAAGLIGMLAAAAQRGDMQLTSAQNEELAVLENEVAGEALLVEQRAVRFAGLLTAAGVNFRLLGGPARARLGYRQPGIRTFSHATVLVEPRGMEITAPPRGITIEPVVRVVDGRSFDIGHLSDPPTLLALAGQPIPTASVEEHLILACFDVAQAWTRDLADPRGVLDLGALRDVAELALFPAIDPVRVQHTAESWGIVDLVSKVLVEVWQLFELADRTRLSVWAYRVADLPVPRGAAAVGPGSGHQERRPTGVVGRMVSKVSKNKLAPSARRVR